MNIYFSSSIQLLHHLSVFVFIQREKRYIEEREKREREEIYRRRERERERENMPWNGRADVAINRRRSSKIIENL
jgi:hypothetical protein